MAANPCLTAPAQGRIPHTTLKCVRTLRDKLPNAQVSVEVEKPGRDGLRELAAEANVVFYSKSWAEVCDTAPQRKLGKILLGVYPPPGSYLPKGLQDGNSGEEKSRTVRTRHKKKKKADRLICIELWSWVCRILPHEREAAESVSMPFQRKARLHVLYVHVPGAAIYFA